MTPVQLVIALIVAGLCGYAADQIGKYKGRGWGFPVGFLLGVIGVVIIACVPRTDDAKVEAARKQYEIQAEAARRAGYQYPPQPPMGATGASWDQTVPPGGPWGQPPYGAWQRPQQP